MAVMRVDFNAQLDLNMVSVVLFFSFSSSFYFILTGRYIHKQVQVTRNDPPLILRDTDSSYDPSVRVFHQLT